MRAWKSVVVNLHPVEIFALDGDKFKATSFLRLITLFRGKGLGLPACLNWAIRSEKAALRKASRFKDNTKKKIENRSMLRMEFEPTISGQAVEEGEYFTQRG